MKIKIVATLGPSTNSKEKIKELIDIGVNVFRLNFSYGTYKEHKKTIETIKDIANKKEKIVGILQDICGPKIRIKGMKEPKEVKKGDILKMAKTPSNEAFSLTYPKIIDDLKEGDEIFFADGTVQTKVIGKSQNEVVLEVLTPGRVMEGKGINFPNANIALHALTKKDIEDIKFGAKEGVDFVAVSFVSSKNDILEAKKILKENGSDAWVVAKIERKSALLNIDEIIEASDAVMVARGDLGAEAGLSKVPILQKEIIKKCNEKAKPVITATQMLTSMINSPFPTRAEVSDVTNAVFDGTDAVMLSDETAIGKYPKEALKTLVDTIKEAQNAYHYYQSYLPSQREAFPYAAAELSTILECDFISALSLSGYTLLHLCKFRPKKKIYLITPNKSLLNKTSLIWGVENAIFIDHFETEKELVNKFSKKAKLKSICFLLVTGYLGEKISQGKSVRHIKR